MLLEINNFDIMYFQQQLDYEEFPSHVTFAAPTSAPPLEGSTTVHIASPIPITNSPNASSYDSSTDRGNNFRPQTNIKPLVHNKVSSSTLLDTRKIPPSPQRIDVNDVSFINNPGNIEYYKLL